MERRFGVRFEDGERTLETVWHNITEIDRVNRVEWMAVVINTYYQLHGNKVSPQQLEKELRERGLKVGLIAVPWESDYSTIGYWKNTNGRLVKWKDMHDYESVLLDQSVKDMIIISCRPRQAVIEETLCHSSSMEENYEKLEEAGDWILHGKKHLSMMDFGTVEFSEINPIMANLFQGDKKIFIQFF